jgi:hypothetical protein
LLAVDPRTKLLETLTLQQAGFEGNGVAPCPFYERLCALFMDDVERSGPVWNVLEPYAAKPFDQAYALRLLGALHRMALSGNSPELAAHFPSTGGDGDAAATYREIEGVLADPPPLIADMFTRPPQTNEVGRSIALATGLLTIANQLKMPIALREIGSSAGLNLRLDTYWYEQDGKGWGNHESKVRFVDMWPDGLRPFDTDLTIADRRGCDRDPIDATNPEGALTLMCYVWPEPAQRFETARAAIEQASGMPVTIDQQDADVWLPRRLADREPGTAMVVMHSVMWQYLSDEDRAACTKAIEDAGAAATTDTPVAWLRLEPHPETFFPGELRVRVWDGESDNETLLANSGFHGGRLTTQAHKAPLVGVDQGAHHENRQGLDPRGRNAAAPKTVPELGHSRSALSEWAIDERAEIRGPLNRPPGLHPQRGAARGILPQRT